MHASWPSQARGDAVRVAYAFSMWGREQKQPSLNNRRLLCALAAFATLASACGGGGSAKGTSTSTTSSSTTTTTTPTETVPPPTTTTVPQAEAISIASGGFSYSVSPDPADTTTFVSPPDQECGIPPPGQQGVFVAIHIENLQTDRPANFPLNGGGFSISAPGVTGLDGAVLVSAWHLQPECQNLNLASDSPIAAGATETVYASTDDFLPASADLTQYVLRFCNAANLAGKWHLDGSPVTDPLTC